MDTQNQPTEESAEARLRRAVKDPTRILVNLGKSVEESVRSALAGRDNVIAVRVNDEALSAIDALVDAGLFKTRSEAGAFLIHEGIRARTDILQQVRDTVAEITRLRENLKHLLATEKGEVLVGGEGVPAGTGGPVSIPVSEAKNPSSTGTPPASTSGGVPDWVSSADR